jgi:DNA processing protein
MNNAILYKALQTRNKYRNPDFTLNLGVRGQFDPDELSKAADYLTAIELKGIKYTYPGHQDYPFAFYKMIEPPLFLEYLGDACWNKMDFISVVGSRDCHGLTADWISTQLVHFLKLDTSIGLVSGGAQGVDLRSHAAALRSGRPTIAVLPCGLSEIYPKDLKYLVTEILNGGGAILSEFSCHQKIHKSFFYFRNRLIASLGKVCLVAQAGIKSGTMLTVHHALQNGRPVITIPAHPGLTDFSGNIKLINDGAFAVTDCLSLYDFWKAEAWSEL